MSKGYPQRTKSQYQGERGVNIVSQIVHEDLGWLFRRNHQENDFGIDGYVEVVTPEGSVTGQMFAVQIKCGPSYLSDKNRWGFVYRGDAKHFNYFANSAVPLLLILCDPDANECYWQMFAPIQTQATGNGWSITIPQDNLLRESKVAILSLLPAADDHLSQLESFWAFNQLIIDSSFISFVISREEVEQLDISGPRAFFDRLAVSKELAYHCQGAVEFTFGGYDDDPRELFEVPEVREYVPHLVAVLPELLFFVRTEQPTHTLKVLALSLTTVTFPYGRSTKEVTRQVVFETDKVGAFLMTMFPGLNAMMDWVGMSHDDNKRITNQILKCFAARGA